MADSKQYKLTELLEICLNFKRDPSKLNSVKLTEVTTSLVCREYLPMAQKRLALILILNSVVANPDLDAVEAEEKLYIGKIVYGLMSYVVNLENDLSAAALKEEIVDLLFETGVADEILSKCSKDFGRLCEMLTEATNFSNLFRLVSITSLYNSESLDKLVDEIRSFKKELTPEMLADLKAIVVDSSTEFQTLKEGIMEKVLGDVMESDINSLDQKPEEVKLNPKFEEEEEEEKKGEEA